MKRRKFIQASLIATSLPAIGAERLHGAPASVSPSQGAGAVVEKFLIPISRTGLPPDTWNEFSRISAMVERVLSSPEEGARFQSSPAHYFGAHGLDSSDLTTKSEVAKVLVCASDPGMRDLVDRRDWTAALTQMRQFGLFEHEAGDTLTQRIQTVLESNIGEIELILRGEGVATDQDREATLLALISGTDRAPTEDDLAIVSKLIAAGDVSPMACTAATVCIAAITAGAFVTAVVYLMVAVVSAAWLMTEVDVNGNIIQPMKRTGHASVPFTGSMARLDPALMRNAERASRIGAVFGSADLQIEVQRGVISKEVDAFVRAMVKVGLINLDESRLDGAVSALQAYALRVAGLPVARVT